jgi:hypothetical protein
MTVILHEDQYTFVIISRSILLKMKNISDENCRENQNKNFMSNIFFSKILFEKKKKNTVAPDRPRMTI